MPERTLRVAIAEDHLLVREGIRQVLDLEPDLDIVATVGTAIDLLDAVAEHGVDVAVTDIRMPPNHHIEGIDAAHEIRRKHPHVGVVVLSAHADNAYAVELFRDGTAGLAYLLKERVGDPADLVDAIRTTADGGSIIDPVIVDTMMRRRRSLSDVLTKRETEVLERMAAGRSNPAIGQALFLSVSAVEKNITSIFGKLGLTEEQATHRRVAAVLAYLAEH